MTSETREVPLENLRLRILVYTHDTLRKNKPTVALRHQQSDCKCSLTKIYPSTYWILEIRSFFQDFGILENTRIWSQNTYVWILVSITSSLQIKSHLKIRDNHSTSICRAFGRIKWDNVCERAPNTKLCMNAYSPFHSLFKSTLLILSLSSSLSLGHQNTKCTVTRLKKKKQKMKQLVVTWSLTTVGQTFS